MSIEDQIPRIKEAIWRRLGTSQRLMPKGLYERLEKDTGVHRNDIRRAFGRLQEEGWLQGVARDGTLMGQVEVLAPRPIAPDPETLMAWREVLARLELPQADIEALLPVHDSLRGLTDADLTRLARGLKALQDELSAGCLEAQFVLSARHLLSSSKIFSQLPQAPLKAFLQAEQLPQEQLPYVLVAGPPEPDSVILIENPRAFEQSIAAGLAQTRALIVTFGYGLNRTGEGFGRQLASLVEDRAEILIPLVRAGNPPPLAMLFAHPRLSFWGDLDPEGLRIFQRLKRRFPQLQLCEIYETMKISLIAEGGHPYISLTGKAGQVAVDHETVADEPLAMELAGLCASRGVDQEAVDQCLLATWAEQKSV